MYIFVLLLLSIPHKNSNYIWFHLPAHDLMDVSYIYCSTIFFLPVEFVIYSWKGQCHTSGQFVELAKIITFLYVLVYVSQSGGIPCDFCSYRKIMHRQRNFCTTLLLDCSKKMSHSDFDPLNPKISEVYEIYCFFFVV